MPKTSVEYATDQITVYRYCPYQCRYCWAWRIPLFANRIKRGRYDPVEEAKRYVKLKDKRVIVVSFTSDPYPPIENYKKLTRKVLEVLARSHHRVMVLTKNPCMALRDQDIFLKGDFWLGTTIVTERFNNTLEPYAPSFLSRFHALEVAKCLGIKTWISIEPIIPEYTNPESIIEFSHRYVDYYVLGAFNYYKQLGFNYSKYELMKWYYLHVTEAIKLLEKYHKPYTVKKELKKYLEVASYA